MKLKKNKKKILTILFIERVSKIILFLIIIYIKIKKIKY